MYGKLFTQMYDGTLGTDGPWQALVTFQQLIILADKDGIVDMTADAIARRTTIPPEIIKTGITTLEQPDAHSRTPDEDGRRIVKLSDGRDWGWRIVNYVHYRNIRSQEERREYMRNYQRKRRAGSVNKPVNKVSNVNQSKGSKHNAKADVLKTIDGLDESAWLRYSEYRAGIGKPIKTPSMDAAKKKMVALGKDQGEAVEETIANGWTGVFPLKNKQTGGNHGKPSKLQRAADAIRRSGPDRYGPTTIVQDGGAEPGLLTNTGRPPGGDSGNG